MTMDLERIRRLYGADRLQGYTEADIALLKEIFGALPQALEDYYRAAGRTGIFHQAEDQWMLPEYFEKWEWLRRTDYLILINENQGVFKAGIRKADLMLPDPPVYITFTFCEEDEAWVICAPSVSGFLMGVLGYEAAFTYEYWPEKGAFYWLTEEELEQIDHVLTKYPCELQTWVCEAEIRLYGNESDNIAVVMVMGEEGEERDIQMFYGGATRQSFERLAAVLEGIGEEV